MTDSLDRDNPHCEFPHCLDGKCNPLCIRQEYRELCGRAARRKLAKQAMEQVQHIENEMDG